MNTVEFLTGIRDAMGFHLHDESTIVRLVADERCIGHDDRAFVEVVTNHKIYNYQLDGADFNELKGAYNHIVVHILHDNNLDATEYGVADE